MNIRWIVRWTLRTNDIDVEYQEGFEFHIMAINKQLALQALGIESVILVAK